MHAEFALGERQMKARNLYRTILGVGFVLLFGVAIAQQNQKSAEPKYIPASPAGWRVTGDDTLGAFSFSEVILQPGSGPPEPHRHSREDELWYILEGELEFRIGERGERTFVAGPGATVFGPRGVPHFFKAVGTNPASYVFVISPAGFERFFAERTQLEKEIPRTDPSFAARSKVLRDKYGLEVSSDWSFPPIGKN